MCPQAAYNLAGSGLETHVWCSMYSTVHAFMECTLKLKSEYPVNQNMRQKPPTPDVSILHFISL